MKQKLLWSALTCLVWLGWTMPVQGQDNALDFDGADDYVDTKAFISGSYTKEAWVYYTGGGEGNNVISGDSITANTALWIPEETGFRLAAGHNGDWDMVQDTAVFPVDQWVYVAVTYNQNQNILTLYKNGLQVSQKKGVPRLNYNDEGDSLWVGAYGTGFFFNGAIDEVRIWNYAKTATELNDSKNLSLAGNETGLIAYYQFNEGTAAGNNASVTTLPDATANANDGTLYNFALTGGNSNWVASTALSTDVTGPSGYSATLDQDIADGSNITAISFTYTGAEVGTTYNYVFKGIGGKQVSGSGTVSAADGQVTNINLTPLSDGIVAFVFYLTDELGNPGMGAADEIIKDTMAPAVTISSTSSGVTNVTPIPITITFSEAVSGFAIGDIAIGNGEAGELQTEDSVTFTTAITPVATGEVTVDIAANVATDTGGQGNTAATQFSIEYDPNALLVSLTAADSVTNQNPFVLTVKFDAQVDGFEVGEITVTGGTAANLATTDSITFTADIAPDAEGKVTMSVAAAAATSKDERNNVASAPLTLRYDATAPTVELVSPSTNPVDTIPLTITFSEIVSGFDSTDITATNATVPTLQTTDSISFTANVLITAGGEVTLAVAAGAVSDLAGNGNAASNQLTFTIDSANPSVTLSSTAGTVTNSNPFPLTVVFSEAVSGFDSADVTVVNGAISGLTTADSVTFTAEITPVQDGAVDISVAQEVALDSQGNGNQASATLSVTFDGTAPTVAISTDEGDTTQANPFVVTITFSEAVSGFDSADFTADNGVASTVQTTDSITFTANITPSADTVVTIAIAAGAVTDAAGNDNTASETFSIVYESAVTGIRDLLVGRNLSVYPVPSNDYLEVAFRLKQPAMVSMVLADSYGKRIKQKTIGKAIEVKETFWIREVPNGLYLLTLYIDGKPLTRKVIISD